MTELAEKYIRTWISENCKETEGGLTVRGDIRSELGPHIKGVRSRHEAKAGATDEHVHIDRGIVLHDLIEYVVVIYKKIKKINGNEM